jgi:hypothetical protein
MLSLQFFVGNIFASVDVKSAIAVFGCLSSSKLSNGPLPLNHQAYYATGHFDLIGL